MRMNRFGLAALFVGFFFSLGKCSVYDESLVSGGGNPKSDASSNACVEAKFPSKPAGTNLGEGNDFFTELKSFDFGEDLPDRGVRLVGYDIDGLCTAGTGTDPTMTDGPGCQPQAGVITKDTLKPEYGDLPGGRDAGLRFLIARIAGVFQGFGTPTYNDQIKAGKVSLLLGIKGYNGQPDDDQVELTVYTPGGSMSDAGQVDGRVRPVFDGRDVWPVALESFRENNPANGPSTMTTQGYVKDNVVVGSLGKIQLRLRIGISEIETTDLQITFSQTFFTAQVKKEPDNLWHLHNGQISAYWTTKDLFAQVKYFPNPLKTDANADPAKLCMNLPLQYPVVRAIICDSADISSTPNAPNPVCDAVSVGIGFEAVQANLDLEPLHLKSLPDLEKQNVCDPKYDPARDSCDRTWDEQLDAGFLN